METDIALEEIIKCPDVIKINIDISLIKQLNVKNKDNKGTQELIKKILVNMGLEDIKIINN